MELAVKNRNVFGKKVKTLRREGFIPAELFGHGLTNKHLSVAEKDFNKVYRTAGESAIVNLVTEAGEKLPVLISDVQRHPLSGQFLAVDFHQVRMDEKIQIKVPVEFVGEAPAVKAGNILVKLINEIEVETLPQHIPHKFEVDVSGLTEVRQSIHVQDLKVPAEVKIRLEPNTVIATITEPAKAEEVAAPAPAPAEGAVPTEQPVAEAKPTSENKNEQSA